MKPKLQNPKSEIRNPKEIRRRKFETVRKAAESHSDFRVRASFGFRASVFGFFLLVWTLIFPTTASAQNYSIDWFTIDGGGGASAGEGYALDGTIGQPDAGFTMSGGSFSLTGGFWSIIAVQTPGAPLLKIFLTATNTAVVSWPSASAGFTLQQNSQLGTGNWTAVGQTVNDNGTNKFIIVNPPTGNRSYRLFKP